MRRWHSALLVLGLSVGTVCLAACSDSKIAGGSVDGARIYNDACARCHGMSGDPTPGMVARSGVKPLTSAAAAALSDEQIAQQIRNGSKNKMMPAFQGALSDAQIEAVIAHVRTLAPGNKAGTK